MAAKDTNWFFEDQGEQTLVYGGDGDLVARVIGNIALPVTAAERGTLIAAAPDLLEALKMLRNVLSVWSIDPDKSPNTILSFIPMMDAAITKATEGVPQ